MFEEESEEYAKEENKEVNSIEINATEISLGGCTVMNRAKADCEDIGNVEQDPKLAGRSILMFVTPKLTTKSGKKPKTDKPAAKKEAGEFSSLSPMNPIKPSPLFGGEGLMD